MKKFEFTIKGQKYGVLIKDFEDNTAHIEVNGTTYEVEVHQDKKVVSKPALVRKAVASKPANGNVSKKATGGGGYKITAPLPGSIFKLNVAVGDTVAKGDTVLIMEAMKMENNIMSEKDGVVKSLSVALNDVVLQGDVLLELE